MEKQKRKEFINKYPSLNEILLKNPELKKEDLLVKEALSYPKVDIDYSAFKSDKIAVMLAKKKHKNNADNNENIVKAFSNWSGNSDHPKWGSFIFNGVKI